ncbi:SAM-dependent chlorinase/fluorinase [Leptolyngbya sp. FACHB-261]|uniref:SAM hydrolase/SAM-dependent halogenase family protein n=1 Tax=Leptolyngbya sp. FACHB-261 TaxID=2692806 RepID=UPI001682290F|nr:SAM-dependent chlorinase/fluorinase [Leptolyngbya sp. FACHB-261]MBD2103820.1 SAM-dependent chlorinase/fluorinase [Leptolyngbya sp. FACHB-261]
MPNLSLLTLLSDFGLQDPYVGVMKGVIATINPAIQVVDLTHELPPQNLLAARFCLTSAVSYFPTGTVHVAVVDPGVGGNRRPVAIQTECGILVGPDNGIFSNFLSQATTAVVLDQPKFWRTSNLSNTFHGRDLFAPVGAHLAMGIALQAVGTAINLASLVCLTLHKNCIQHIDRFGNLITTIRGEQVVNQTWSVLAAGQIIKGEVTYSSVSSGQLLALVGSHGFVEIACNAGSAQQRLGLTWGDSITLQLTAPSSNDVD